MNIDQITDLAYEVVNELEPAQSFDVFEVTDSEIIFQDERGLYRMCLACIDSYSIKQEIKTALLNTE